jgi:hypothetical protein
MHIPDRLTPAFTVTNFSCRCDVVWRGGCGSG